MAGPLLANGLQVRAILRRPAPALDPAIEPWLASLGNPQALEKALVGMDAVIHLAGAVRGRRPRDFRPANVDAVVHLAAAAARQERPPAFLLVSSLAASQPQLSDYAASKRAGEQALSAHSGLDWTIVRPPAVYGPGDVELRPMLRLLRRGFAVIPGNARQRLAFLHVDDLAAAILRWLEEPARCRQRRFSIDDGTPGGYDWPAIAAAAGGSGKCRMVIPPWALRLAARLNLLLSRLWGRAPMLTPGKVRELLHDCWVGGDNSYGAVTGWRPRHDLASGIEQTLGGK